MFKYFISIIYWIILLSSISCSARKNESFFLESETPFPGTIKIDSNLFIDKAEITNFHWNEYIYWTQRIMGKDSKEYKECFPNTYLWLKEDSCIAQEYSDYYLFHPDYKDLPVVGITQDQAEKFLTWRSERVFEYYLIKHKIIDMIPEQTRDNYFSFESYFSGNYMGYEPDTNITHIPNFRLPTKEEWTKGKIFTDSINQTLKIKECKDKYCSLKIAKDSLPIFYNITISAPLNCLNPPLQATSCNNNPNLILHMYGNAAEWLFDTSAFIGGSWKDSDISNFDKVNFSTNSSSTTVGFRAVCSWIKIK